MTVLPFRPPLPHPRVELYAADLDGAPSYVVDLVGDEGRENLHVTSDLADALRSAEWCAEGDGEETFRIPLVNLLPPRVADGQ